MDSPDINFVRDYKPLHVPHRYKPEGPIEDNVVYALAQLETATADEVAQKLFELEPDTALSVHQKVADRVLSGLFEKGLIKGSDDEPRKYDLSKILVQNSGKADPLY